MVDPYDTVVVGGGAAGILAAWSAAHQGARVALIEAAPACGGIVRHGLQRWLCGLFPCDVPQPNEFLHGEGVERFCRLLVRDDPRKHAVRRGRVWLLPIASGATFSACAHELLSSEPTLELFTHDPVVSASMSTGQGPASGRKITAVTLRSGKTLEASVCIDCTGQAVLSHMAGALIDTPKEPALSGFGFEVEGLRFSEASVFGLAIDVPKACRTAVESGFLPHETLYTTCESSVEPSCAWVRMALAPGVRGEEARSAAQELFSFLQRQLPAFKEARMRTLLPYPLLREAPRLRGRYTLTENDVLSARTFDDAIARNSWPIERWDSEKGVRYGYLPEGQWHEIPARCLQPAQGPSNLLCAGMMLSADSGAQASIRVIATCMATGEAAGKMAVQHAL
jgi:FAD dependent oxidoreductase